MNNIFRALQRGHMTRAQLVELTGLDDRTVRERIEELRREGVPICSSLSGGYFIAQTWDELESFLNRYRRTATKVLSTANKMAKAYARGGQYEIHL